MDYRPGDTFKEYIPINVLGVATSPATTPVAIIYKDGVDDSANFAITETLPRAGSLLLSGTVPASGYSRGNFFQAEILISDGTNTSIVHGQVHGIAFDYSSLATSTALTAVDDLIDTEIATIINRLGAFTGTGVNTVLGLLKALASKAATLPSDIGGTFDPANDALEAIVDNTLGVPDGVSIAADIIGLGNSLGIVDTLIKTLHKELISGSAHSSTSNYPYTLLEILRLIAATVAGQTGNANSSPEEFYDIADSELLVYQVSFDSSGNRNSITYPDF